MHDPEWDNPELADDIERDGELVTGVFDNGRLAGVLALVVWAVSDALRCVAKAIDACCDALNRLGFWIVERSRA